MPKVSVITPAFNVALFLEETIKSVQAQTFGDWEMIIVDDCSSDETFKIANDFSKNDSRIKVLQNEKNSGVAAARNKALDVAVGQYVAFLDADDLWLPKKLESQIKFMEAGQHVLTYTNYQKFDSDTGKRYGKIIKAPSTMSAKKIYGDTSIGCLTVMVDRTISGMFHMPIVEHTEDNITWQNILAKGFMAYRLDEVLALYRVGNKSLTSGKKKAAKQQWQIYREYYNFSIPKSALYFASYAFYAVKKHFF